MPDLVYIGDGAFLPGVPARDLKAEEVVDAAVTFLVTSGLYEVAPEPKQKEPPKKRGEEVK